MQIKIILFFGVFLVKASEHKFQLPSSDQINQIINTQNNHIFGKISDKLANQKLTEQQILDETYNQLKLSFPNIKQRPKCNEGIALTARTLTSQIVNNLSNQ